MSTREDVSLAKVNAEIDECTALLETLRARFEQYFLGIERLAPERERKDIVRRLHQLEHLTLNNTASKFKLQTLSQKFRTYNEYWGRTLRQIEDGTYVRHVAKARKLAERLDTPPKAAATPTPEAAAAPAAAPKPSARSFLDEIGDLADDFLASLDQTFGAAPKPASKPSPNPAPPPPAQAAAPQQAPAPARTAPAQAAPAQPPAQDEARALYEQLARARAQASGGKVGAGMPPLEDFKRSLDRQAEQLRQGNPARKVRFRVVVQDGKPLIQPLVEP